MKKINLITALIFCSQLSIAQTTNQPISKSDSLFFRDYSLSCRMKNNSIVNSGINVKTNDYNKILQKLTKQKKFDFREKSFTVKNLEIKGLSEMIDLKIIEGVHSKTVDSKGSIFYGFTIFSNQKDKEAAQKNQDSNQKLGLCIYFEKKGKNKFLSDTEMNLVIEYLKSI